MMVLVMRMLLTGSPLFFLSSNSCLCWFLWFSLLFFLWNSATSLLKLNIIVIQMTSLTILKLYMGYERWIIFLEEFSVLKKNVFKME